MKPLIRKTRTFLSIAHNLSPNTKFIEDEWHKIKWGPWKRKFALLPTKIGKSKIWLNFYYRRYGNSKMIYFKQLGDFMNIIESNSETYENLKG